MTDNAAVWVERVEEFRRSGKTAPVFAEGRGYSASALKYWDRKLKARPTRSVALARVVRPGTVVLPASSEGVELLVAGVRIVVRRGFDAELRRQLVAALAGRS
jgi:hypothetical protein